MIVRLVRWVFEGYWPKWAMNLIQGFFALLFVSVLLLGVLFIGGIVVPSLVWSILNR